MTQYMARSAWTSTARGGSRLSGTKLVGLACHWPGTTTSAYGVESASKVAARLRGWRSYHVNGRGWSDIGYNMAVDQAGRIWDLRGLSRVGAHAASGRNPDANHEWVGVLFVLGANEKPSAAMIQAFQDFRHDVFLRRWSGRTKLTGHGRAPGVPGAQTSCPGPGVAAKITDGSLGRRPSGPTPEPEDDMPSKAEFFKWMKEYDTSVEGRTAFLQSLILAFRGEDQLSQELRVEMDKTFGPIYRSNLKQSIEAAADRSSPFGRQLGTALSTALDRAGFDETVSAQVDGIVRQALKDAAAAEGSE